MKTSKRHKNPSRSHLRVQPDKQWRRPDQRKSTKGVRKTPFSSIIHCFHSCLRTLLHFKQPIRCNAKKKGEDITKNPNAPSSDGDQVPYNHIKGVQAPHQKNKRLILPSRRHKASDRSSRKLRGEHSNTGRAVTFDKLANSPKTKSAPKLDLRRFWVALRRSLLRSVNAVFLTSSTNKQGHPFVYKKGSRQHFIQLHKNANSSSTFEEPHNQITHTIPQNQLKDCNN
jgi:hypothetical protein